MLLARYLSTAVVTRVNNSERASLRPLYLVSLFGCVHILLNLFEHRKRLHHRSMQHQTQENHSLVLIHKPIKWAWFGKRMCLLLVSRCSAPSLTFSLSLPPKASPPKPCANTPPPAETCTPGISDSTHRSRPMPHSISPPRT